MPLQDSITTTTLLKRLFVEQDSMAWSIFHQRFRPILRGTARRMGLGDADAEEVVQECLLRTVQGYRDGGYVRTGGRLRSWMLAILRNSVRDLQRRRAREAPLDSDGLVTLAATTEEVQSLWDEEARRQLAIDVLALLQRCGDFEASTLRAFEQHVLLGRDAKDVALELEVGVWSIYKARQRCTARFREVARGFSELYGISVK